MEGRSEMRSEFPGTIEVSVAAIGQGYTGISQYANTPKDRYSGEKRSPYLCPDVSKNISKHMTQCV